MSQTDVGDLPEGWRMVTFGEVARNVDIHERSPLENGIERFVGLDHIQPQHLHIKRWGNTADGTTFTRRFKPGQVLFGKRRAYQRKAAVADFDGVCSGDILVFEPARDDLVPELLPFIVESEGFFEHALRTSAGSLSPRTKWKDLAGYAFPLPPKEEQRRIADILWAADAAVERWRELLEQTTTTRWRLLNAIFGIHFADWLPIEKLATVITSGSRGWAAYHSATGALFVRVTNLGREDLALDMSDTQHVTPPNNAEGTRTRVFDGDLLMSITADLGRIAIAPGDIGEAFVNQHVALVRPNKATAYAPFVGYALSSPAGQMQFRSFNDAGAKAGMNLRNVGRLKVPDLTKDEQQRIVAPLEALDRARRATIRQLERMEEFRRSLGRCLFHV